MIFYNICNVLLSH